ncbi:hypothetical protein, partial [Mesorhizobium sp.]|uniref:hypothetical protein n=1 Tax=Mesorhizobium sp. TaxID=1871066 RepID=UPI0025EA9AF6
MDDRTDMMNSPWLMPALSCRHPKDVAHPGDPTGRRDFFVELPQPPVSAAARKKSSGSSTSVSRRFSIVQ